MIRVSLKKKKEIKEEKKEPQDHLSSPSFLCREQKIEREEEEEKGEEALLTLLPSNMMTTSFWAYSCISVNQAFQEKKKKYKGIRNR